MDLAAETSRQMASLAGRVLLLTGELDRREGWRDEGATSRRGVARRALRHLGRHGASVGPRRPASLRPARPRGGAVRGRDQLRQGARRRRRCDPRDRPGRGASKHVRRQCRELAQLDRSVLRRPRNDRHDAVPCVSTTTYRTLTAQLPPESYAEVRGAARGPWPRRSLRRTTPWDQRVADAFVSFGPLSGSGRWRSPLSRRGPRPTGRPARRDPAEPSKLAAELDRGGHISVETLRRIACDATIVDRGRRRRGPHDVRRAGPLVIPTDAQRREIRRATAHCRFPSCTNATFTNPHHVDPWKPDGPTDLRQSGVCSASTTTTWCTVGVDGVGRRERRAHLRRPDGRVMTSRPSPLWTS